MAVLKIMLMLFVMAAAFVLAKGNVLLLLAFLFIGMCLLFKLYKEV